MTTDTSEYGRAPSSKKRPWAAIVWLLMLLVVIVAIAPLCPEVPDDGNDPPSGDLEWGSYLWTVRWIPVDSHSVSTTNHRAGCRIIFTNDSIKWIHLRADDIDDLAEHPNLDPNYEEGWDNFGECQRGYFYGPEDLQHPLDTTDDGYVRASCWGTSCSYFFEPSLYEPLGGDGYYPLGDNWRIYARFVKVWTDTLGIRDSSFGQWEDLGRLFTKKPLRVKSVEVYGSGHREKNKPYFEALKHSMMDYVPGENYPRHDRRTWWHFTDRDLHHTTYPQSGALTETIPSTGDPWWDHFDYFMHNAQCSAQVSGYPLFLISLYAYQDAIHTNYGGATVANWNPTGDRYDVSPSFVYAGWTRDSLPDDNGYDTLVISKTVTHELGHQIAYTYDSNVSPPPEEPRNNFHCPYCTYVRGVDWGWRPDTAYNCLECVTLFRWDMYTHP